MLLKNLTVSSHGKFYTLHAKIEDFFQAHKMFETKDQYFESHKPGKGLGTPAYQSYAKFLNDPETMKIELPKDKFKSCIPHEPQGNKYFKTHSKSHIFLNSMPFSLCF